MDYNQQKIAYIKQQLGISQTQLATRKGEQDILVADLKRNQQLHDTSVEERDLYAQVSVLLQEVGNQARDSAKHFLEQIVTSALQYVSGGAYSFVIEFSVKNKRPNADMYVVEDINGEESKQKPEDACGGGFVDIITTALRLGYIEILNNPKPKGLLLLDEPGKMISETASLHYGEFVRDMITSYDRQCIMITHNKALMGVADHSILVEKHNGKSVILDPAVAGKIDTALANPLDMMEAFLDEELSSSK